MNREEKLFVVRIDIDLYEIEDHCDQEKQETSVCIRKIAGVPGVTKKKYMDEQKAEFPHQNDNLVIIFTGHVTIEQTTILGNYLLRVKSSLFLLYVEPRKQNNREHSAYKKSQRESQEQSPSAVSSSFTFY